MRPSAALGRDGEAAVVRYLESIGLEVIDRNWRCQLGEVDVVALDGDCLVIVEVKTRKSVRFGTPVEAVTADKVRRLRDLAHAYRASHDLTPTRMRVDVIGVLAVPGQSVQLTHLRGVC